MCDKSVTKVWQCVTSISKRCHTRLKCVTKLLSKYLICDTVWQPVWQCHICIYQWWKSTKVLCKTQHSERVHLYMLRRRSVSAGCCWAHNALAIHNAKFGVLFSLVKMLIKWCTSDGNLSTHNASWQSPIVLTSFTRARVDAFYLRLNTRKKYL